ncbi:MAG: hypothetical protein V1729_06970 [Candidatus Woesearchaeota archaeon]
MAKSKKDIILAHVEEIIKDYSELESDADKLGMPEIKELAKLGVDYYKDAAKEIIKLPASFEEVNRILVDLFSKRRQMLENPEAQGVVEPKSSSRPADKVQTKEHDEVDLLVKKANDLVAQGRVIEARLYLGKARQKAAGIDDGLKDEIDALIKEVSAKAYEELDRAVKEFLDTDILLSEGRFEELVAFFTIKGKNSEEKRQWISDMLKKTPETLVNVAILLKHAEGDKDKKDEIKDIVLKSANKRESYLEKLVSKEERKDVSKIMGGSLPETPSEDRLCAYRIIEFHLNKLIKAIESDKLPQVEFREK